MPPIKAGNIAALGYNLIHHKNQLSVSIFNITSKIYIYLFFRQSFHQYIITQEILPYKLYNFQIFLMTVKHLLLHYYYHTFAPCIIVTSPPPLSILCSPEQNAANVEKKRICRTQKIILSLKIYRNSQPTLV